MGRGRPEGGGEHAFSERAFWGTKEDDCWREGWGVYIHRYYEICLLTVSNLGHSYKVPSQMVSDVTVREGLNPMVRFWILGRFCPFSLLSQYNTYEEGIGGCRWVEGFQGSTKGKWEKKEIVKGKGKTYLPHR